MNHEALIPSKVPNPEQKPSNDAINCKKGSLSHHRPWIKLYVCNTQLPLCLDKLALLPVNPLIDCNKEEWFDICPAAS